MIRIKREKYFQHIVTNPEAHNETSSTEFPVLGNYSCDSDFGNFSPCLSEVLISQKSELSLHDNSEILEQYSKPKRNLHTQIIKDENEIPEVDLDQRVPNFMYETWTLFFDKSKSQEGVGAIYIFIYPAGKHSFLSCILEFRCINNTVEYEALVQGLKKATGLNIKELVVFNDS